MTSLCPTRRERRAFTLIEVLATMLLLAIVMPAIMRGLATSAETSLFARRHNEATALAEQKLNEIIATGEWQTAQLSGDFGSDWPDYHWTSNVQAWAGDNTTPPIGLEQVDVKVTWINRGSEQSLTLSTLTYNRGQSQ